MQTHLIKSSQPSRFNSNMDLQTQEQNTLSQQQTPQLPLQAKHSKVWIFGFGVITFLILLTGGTYLLGRNSTQQTPLAVVPTIVTPTPSPILTIDPTPSVPQTIENNLLWTIKPIQKKITDDTADLHLINTKTNEDLTVGKIHVYGQQYNAIISSDNSLLIFVNILDELNSLTDTLTVYSIPEKKALKTLTLETVKKLHPQLRIPRNASLSHLAISPNNQKIATSYGYILEHDNNSDIIIFNHISGKVVTANRKGVTKTWKDNSILQYETIDEDSPTPVSGGFQKIITKELTIE